MFFIFDIIFILTSFFFHSISLFLTLTLVTPFWADTLLSQTLLIVAGYFIFLNIFPIMIGIFRFIFQPRLPCGEFPVGLNRGYGSYVINSLLHGVFVSSPFYKQCSFILYLKWIFYRLFGMKLPYSSIVSVESTIRQPELIEVGEKSILGLGCIISCHYSPHAKSHIQEKVIIGSNTVIGGYAIIAPDFRIGSNSVIGAKSSSYPGVRIGDNVKIGSECTLFFGAKIPNNVKIKSHSFIDKNCEIKEGEIWGGNPAVKIGDL